MKKFLCFLLISTLCLSASTVWANTFTVLVDSVDAAPNETVTVNVSLKNNCGILAARFQLDYDKDRLILVGAKDHRLLEGGIFSKSYDTYPYTMVWNSASTKNFTNDGVLVTLSFQVREDAPSGKAFVNLSYRDDDVFDVDLNNVALDIENGTITVIGGIEPPAATATPTPTPTQVPSVGGGGGGGISAPPSKPTPTKVPISTPVPEENADTHLTFTDVNETDWYYPAVKFAFASGITSGVSATEFAPNDTVTRGQFITMLCRAYGISEMLGENFVDCGNTWYTGYLAAAKQLGISNGVGENRFAPEAAITREEMVALIYNYLNVVQAVDIHPETVTFADSSSISGWAKDAVAFASQQGFVQGKGNHHFDPQGNATRAELAQIFMNMLR